MPLIPVPRSGWSHIDYQNPVTDDALNRGLVHWWLSTSLVFGSNTLRDLTSGKWHGTLTNFSLPSAWIRQNIRPGGRASIEFDDTATTSIEMGEMDPPQVATISCWAKHNIVALSKMLGGFATSSYDDFRLIVLQKTNTNDWLARVKGGDGTLTTVSYGTGRHNVWHHFTAVAEDLTVTVYLDGEYVNSAAKTSGIRTSGTVGFALGHHYGRPGSWWNGWCDDVRLYNRALSAGEVRAYYQDSLAGHPRTLRGNPSFVPFPASAEEEAAARPMFEDSNIMLPGLIG